MSGSVEFHLARLTARSIGMDPKQPGGGLPVFTPDDIRAAISLATEPGEFHAMMAKYCQERRSAEILADVLARWSAWEFLTRYPTWRLTGQINQGIAETAVLFFLNPEAGRRKGDVGHAAHVGVGRNTWASYYREHWKRATARLFDYETRGLARIRNVLRR